MKDKSYLWLIAMYLVQIGAWTSLGTGNILLVIATFMALTCVFLIAKGNKWNFVLGLISSFIFMINAWDNGIKGEALVQMGYILFDIFGIYLWYRFGKNYDSDSKTINLPTTEVALAIITTIGVFLLLLASVANSWIDATAGAVGLLAMYFTARKYTYAFVVWVLANIFQVAVWVSLHHTDGFATGIMYFVFLINSLYGLYIWVFQKEQVIK
ncbi:nicotinamide riboside transporter PnuC [Vagococcus intermedius]|uniref:Nicotinamide riboside transporter PnuC n=1 Tax=Vagococcus intermedius TaxID=2991418 RepID=A0AAF0I5U2_9ENTE|nr:nicotinamide riboside transporter PnuC [Vagococcus intermedius]WEG72389.1 nicotinamide riboside transporter PnuC [Vagococcus intermedius]WEG74477.1 nicotinamide riboside transporter PnuC [Vagococcus intermedius]